jgi:hypothetical protein
MIPCNVSEHSLMQSELKTAAPDSPQLEMEA